MTMVAKDFLLQEVVNPTNGEISQRLAVRFDNAKILKFWQGKDDNGEVIPLDVATAAIKKELGANREAYLKRIVVLEGEFGLYCRVTNAKTLEEF